MAAKRCPIFRKLKWHSYPGGAYAPISRARAKFVLRRAKSNASRGRGVPGVNRLWGEYPLPRPGREVGICPGMRLVNRAGKFELDRAWEGFRRRRS